MGASDAGRRSRTPFVGRADERAAIAGRLAEGAAGRAGVVWVEGPAGSGKTALVRRALLDLPADVLVRRAFAEPHEVEPGGAVIDQLLDGAPVAEGSFAAGQQLLRAVEAHDGPTVVVVEDLHWAEPASRQALLAAARRWDDDPVTLLVTSRPGGPADGWDRLVLDDDRCLRIDVGPLGGDDVRALAAEAGLTLAPPAAERLRAHTGGLALHVRTLLAELPPEELVRADGPLPAPRSLASTTLARLAELPPPARELAAALAVLDRRSPLAVVAEVADLEDAADALDPLLATDLVTWWPADPATPLAFAHPLLRAAVYDDLAPSRRHALHAAAATATSGAAALAHRVAAADRADAALAEDLRASAQELTARGDAEAAARHRAWAAAVEPDPGRADGDVVTAALDLLVDGQLPGALLERVRAARPGAGRDLVLGVIALDDGDFRQADLLLAGAEAAEDADAEVRFVAEVHRASCATLTGRATDAIAHAEAALAVDPAAVAPHRHASLRPIAVTGWGFGTMIAEGGVVAHERMTDRLAAPAEHVAAADADVLVTRGALAFYAGRNGDVAADMLAAIALARSGALVHQLGRAHLHLGQSLYYQGEWDDSLVHSRLSIALEAESGDGTWIAGQAHAVLAMALGSRGQEEPALRHLEAARAAAEAHGTMELVFTAQISAGAIARAAGDHDGVVAAIAPLVVPELLPMATTLGWWPPLVAAAIDTGDLVRAETWIDELATAAVARRLDLAARVDWLRGRLAQARGDGDRAAARMEAAAAALGDDDPYLDRALVHHDLGRILVARGARRPGVDHLRRAHEMLVRVRAEPFVARVAEDLTAAGIRSGAATGGALDLTDREQDVVALVRQGLSNREVAASLYISVKAVEYHLGNVYGKLGIRSRRELRALDAGDD